MTAFSDIKNQWRMIDAKVHSDDEISNDANVLLSDI